MTLDSSPIPNDAELGPAIGSTIGRKYVVESLLGQGGMGAVYRARHNVTGRRVALKWMLDASDATRERFLREARAMGFIEHPSVVSVLDVGEHEGGGFIVMELLRGQSLRDYLGGKRTTVEEAVSVLMPALEGLAALHLAGIVHRDLKPDNLFVCRDDTGRVLGTKLLDLGVARLQVRRGEEAGDLTMSGAVIGTPKYMAPEQLRALRDVDARADIFAVGLILYEMLTGRLPYDAGTYEALVIDIATSDPPTPLVFRPELPEALAAVVLKALARDRDSRFADVASLATALEAFGSGTRFTPPTSDNIRGSIVPDEPFVPASIEHDATRQGSPSTEPRATVRGRASPGRVSATTPARPGAMADPIAHAESPEAADVVPTRHAPAWRWPAVGVGAVLIVVASWVATRPSTRDAHPNEPAPRVVSPPASTQDAPAGSNARAAALPHEPAGLATPQTRDAGLAQSDAQGLAPPRDANTSPQRTAPAPRLSQTAVAHPESTLRAAPTQSAAMPATATTATTAPPVPMTTRPASTILHTDEF